MDISTIITLTTLGVTILTTLVIVVWKVSAIHTTVDQIMENHLPHIEKWLERLEKKLK